MKTTTNNDGTETILQIQPLVIPIPYQGGGELMDALDTPTD